MTLVFFSELYSEITTDHWQLVGIHVCWDGEESLSFEMVLNHFSGVRKGLIGLKIFQDGFWDFGEEKNFIVFISIKEVATAPTRAASIFII